MLLSASFFLFTIISTGDENKIFQLIVALFACLLLILMEMMVMVRIKGIGWWWAREGVQLGPPRSTNHYWPPALPHYWRQHFVQHTTDYWQVPTRCTQRSHFYSTATLLWKRRSRCESTPTRRPSTGLRLWCARWAPTGHCVDSFGQVAMCNVKCGGGCTGHPLGTVWILLLGDKLHLHFGHNWHPEGKLHRGPLGIVHTSTN